MGRSWSRTDRLIRLARLRGDRAAELIIEGDTDGGGSATFTPVGIREPHANTVSVRIPFNAQWTEAELRAAWGDR